MPITPLNSADYLINTKKDGAHICPSSAQVSGKTFETNGNEYDNPILVLIFKGHSLGLYRKMIKHQGRAYHTSSIVSIFACSFPNFEHETDKAKYAYLDRMAILSFYTEPPIGNVKVVIKNGLRMVFLIFNMVFNINIRFFSVICIEEIH